MHNKYSFLRTYFRKVRLFGTAVSLGQIGSAQRVPIKRNRL